MPLQLRHARIHGHDVGYRMAGKGPVIVLIHGMAGSSRTWLDVMRILARDYTVIAPDLLGHGESAKPMGDYSLGAYASGLRDLLVGALGIEQRDARRAVARRRRRDAARLSASGALRATRAGRAAAASAAR